MLGRLPVIVNGEWREAAINFASEREVKRLCYWRISQSLPDDAISTRKIYDAAEFARLACNRWRYYHRQQLAVTSLAELERMIGENPSAELAMVLIARPTWRSQISTLGIAYLRRTWCNHIFLEFFTAHPQVIAQRQEQIKAVGDAMMHQILALSESLDVPCIWGEATELSHEWYEKHLTISEVRDHFFIEDEVMTHCLKEMRRAQREMLARRETT